MVGLLQATLRQAVRTADQEGDVVRGLGPGTEVPRERGRGPGLAVFVESNDSGATRDCLQQARRLLRARAIRIGASVAARRSYLDQPEPATRRESHRILLERGFHPCRYAMRDAEEVDAHGEAAAAHGVDDQGTAG